MPNNTVEIGSKKQKTHHLMSGNVLAEGCRKGFLALGDSLGEKVNTH